MRHTVLAAVVSAGLLVPAAPAALAAPTATGTAASTASLRPPQPPTGAIDTEDLARRYDQGPQYRIPALTTSTKGTVIAAYDRRPTMADVPSNIAIVIRRSTDGGRTWLPQQVVRESPAPEGHGDPSLLVDRETGRIFVLYVSSINQGFGGGATGNSDTDPNATQMDYSYSDDDGVTWQHRRITSMAKNPAWGGLFAASGEGIQLRHGAHAGRLVQQYAIRYNGQNYAASLYSDDHGATWTFGQLVGPGADENKTVELSNGDVMLNSRTAPYRKVAISHDGGETYGPFEADPELPDSGNNGSIMRLYPNAPADDPRSKMLLFSNTPDPSIRRGATVRMSCDDGQTWPVSKAITQGSSGYSTLSHLPDGRIGLLWEREGYEYITMSRFDVSWLAGLCAPLSLTLPASHQAGTKASATVRVTNQTSGTLAPGNVTLEPGTTWAAGSVRVPRLAAGETRTVSVPFSAPTSVVGDKPITARYTVDGQSSSTRSTLTVTPAANPPAAPAVSGELYPDSTVPLGAAGWADDRLAFWMRVGSTGNQQLTDVTVTGNLDNLASCHYSALAAGQSYLCKTATHTVTAAEVAAGQYAPLVTVTGTTPSGRRVSQTVTPQPIVVRNP
ncbi:exo-alpha-sialidase [Luteipulveratus sp. YIM 133132]|uniref:exo-alpha-sialidase n=1 Tax=Luteipulveratus flavus TaxID=3031728 RepID=UPI0023AED7D2|nr:exo-alpha-sialidase [Luteipulveratus sp. YIM 133132]MDE9367227.1 exo-alpha-sialidase [Luteipulveratus sp. YIM 133132]